MNVFLYSIFGFVVNLDYVSDSDIYPSINWDPHNPLFIADGVTCDQGARRLNVKLYSKVNFICPNTANVLQTTSNQVQTKDMYENLWIVYNKTVFDKCNTSLEGVNKTSRLLLLCNTPTKLNYYSLSFAEYAAHENALLFQPGMTYYFIGTSDGTESHINDSSGGHCADISNNISMKIEVYVCMESNSTYKDPSCSTGVGKLECPSIPAVTNSSSVATYTSTAGTTLPLTTTGAPVAVCANSVITYTTTMYSESTASSLLSCADLLNKSTFSTTSAPTATPLAGESEAVSPSLISALTANTTIQDPQNMLTSKAEPTALRPSTNRILTTQMSSPALETSESIDNIETVSSTQTVATATTFTPNKTLQVSQMVSPVDLISSKSVPCVLISTTTVTKVTQTNASSKPGQQAKQAKLSGNGNTSCNEGMWMTFGILFFILFAILIVLLFIMCIIYKKKIFHRYSSKVSPQEARNEGVNPMRYCSRGDNDVT